MRKLFLVILLSGFVSCNVFKTTTKQKNKKRIQTTEHITENVIEKGVRIERLEPDSIIFNHRLIVPDLDSIYEKQTKNLDLKIKTKKGNVVQTACKQKPHYNINPYERNEQKKVDTQKKESVKTTDSKSEGLPIKPAYFIYLFLGIGFLIVVNNLTKRKN